MHIRHHVLGLVITACAMTLVAASTKQDLNYRAVIQSICTGTLPKETLAKLSPQELRQVRRLLEREIVDLHAGEDSLELVDSLERVTPARVLSWLALGIGACFAYHFVYQATAALDAHANVIATKEALVSFGNILIRCIQQRQSLKALEGGKVPFLPTVELPALITRDFDGLFPARFKDIMPTAAPAACTLLSLLAYRKFANIDDRNNLEPQELIDYIDSLNAQKPTVALVPAT